MRYHIANKDVVGQLGSLSCNDIAPKVKKRKPASYFIWNTLRVIIFLVCLCVFIYSVKSIADNFSSYNEGNDYYENIKNDFIYTNESANANLVSSSKPVPLKGFEAMLEGKGEVLPPVPNEDLMELLSWQNRLNGMKGEIPDIYGWITIPGTNIDYPVVQGTDNQFYVEHTADKKINVSGAIFVDFRQKKAPESTQNLVLYGHNIRTWGTMFNGLVNYLYEDFYKTHPTVNFYTYNGIYEYTIFSVCETDIHSNYTDIYFSNDSEFESFCQDTLNRSLYTRDGITIDKNSKLITLSTCSNSFNGDKRYSVVAVLTNVITAN